MSVKIQSERRGTERPPAGRQGLATRRRKQRQRFIVALGVLFCFCIGGVIYFLQQPFIRISRVDVFGANASLSATALEALKGSYLGLVPRDSIVFFPASTIRSRLLAVDSDIGAISIFRSGLTSLSVKVVNRVPIAKWCGSEYHARSQQLSTSSPEVAPREQCYVFDDTGRIFASTTEEQFINNFVVYAPISTSGTTIGSTLPNHEKLPDTFNFARELSTLGSPVRAVAIHDTEVDNYLESGTRITYVLGQEQNAYTALVSATPNINLANGSVQYVDLRFSGKVYVKKKGDTLP